MTSFTLATRRSAVITAVFVLFYVVLGLEPLWANDVALVGDRLKDILSKQQVHLDRQISGNPALCGALLRDLKDKRNVEFPEPVFRTEDANDPRLSAYHGCKKYWSRGRHGEIPENSYSFLEELGTRGFALYRIDIDNNPANGIEELLYAETDPDNPTSTSVGRVFPGYTRVDLKHCLLIEGVSASQTYQGMGVERDNLNAVIRYQKRYYVLNLVRFDVGTGADFSLELWNFKSNIKNKRDTYACVWRTMKR